MKQLHNTILKTASLQFNISHKLERPGSDGATRQIFAVILECRPGLDTSHYLLYCYLSEALWHSMTMQSRSIHNQTSSNKHIGRREQTDALPTPVVEEVVVEVVVVEVVALLDSSTGSSLTQ